MTKVWNNFPAMNPLKNKKTFFKFCVANVA